MTPMNPLPPLGPKDKLSPELRIVIASFLSILVIAGYLKLCGPKPPEHPVQLNPPPVSGPSTPGLPGAANNQQATTNPSTTSTVSASTNPSAIGESQERIIVVENALYRVEFSNRGAVVKSWQLKKYKDDSKPQKPLDVVHAQAAQ